VRAHAAGLPFFLYIVILLSKGIFVETTTLLIPDENDGEVFFYI
jgi:hypothetical protein